MPLPDPTTRPLVGVGGPPRATRAVEERILGGVASGLAHHLGLEVWPVRVFFLLTVLASGFGVVLYAALWVVVPAAPHLADRAPGLAAAERQGRRASRRRIEEAGPLVAVLAVGSGAALLVGIPLGGGNLLLWPLLLAAVGVVVLWRQADEAQRARWVDSSGRVDVRRALLGEGGPAAWTRLAAGAGLLVAALSLFAVQSGTFGAAGDVLLAGLLGVGGLALTAWPWLLRLLGDLSEERAARVRTEERADVAAHLHDSVLQTLALIQRHAEDPRRVATLARAQERDLRSWLFEDPGDAATSVAAALRAEAASVEDGLGVPVEVVAVGDAPLGERLRPLVDAAREAMANAARHSGAPVVDVYAETGPAGCEVFVRDRGAGFDLAAVPGDRLGVRRSIEERMTRHGGSARVRTAPGEGTEVRLSMPAVTERSGP